MMTAMVFDRCGPPEVLHEAQLPVRVPRSGELLIHVMATGVNPIDWRIRSGQMWPLLPHHRPYMVGFDLSGVVARTGRNVPDRREGDAVIGLLAPWQRGATAEYAVIDADRTTIKPAALTFTEAAALPLAGLTAHDALLKRAKLKAGMRILIVGASGGVGTYAVQLAKLCGAHVTTVTSKQNVELVRKLGADECVAYDQEEVHGRFDVILDAVGSMPYPRARFHLEAHGKHVALVPSIANIPSSLVGRSSLNLLPDVRHLPALVDLAASKKLRSMIGQVYPLEQLAEAHRDSESKHVRGKLVIGSTDAHRT